VGKCLSASGGKRGAGSHRLTRMGRDGGNGRNGRNGRGGRERLRFAAGDTTRRRIADSAFDASRHSTGSRRRAGLRMKLRKRRRTDGGPFDPDRGIGAGCAPTAAPKRIRGKLQAARRRGPTNDDGADGRVGDSLLPTARRRATPGLREIPGTGLPLHRRPGTSNRSAQVS